MPPPLSLSFLIKVQKMGGWTGIVTPDTGRALGLCLWIVTGGFF